MTTTTTTEQPQQTTNMTEQQQQTTTNMTEQQQQQGPSSLLYVVTALVNRGDPHSPRLVGVYTSQDKAIQNARSFFETRADTYSDGKFIVDGDDDDDDEFVLKQQDFSKNLVLRENCPFKRVLAEVEQGGGDEGWGFSVVVAVNAIRCGGTASAAAASSSSSSSVLPLEEQPVPLLRQGEFLAGDYSHAYNLSDGLKPVQDDGNGETAAAPEDDDSKEQKVHVIMAADDTEPSEDTTLLGVFFDKSLAIQAAKARFAEKNKGDDDEITDNTTTIGDRGDLLSLFSESFLSYSIAMDTLVLDKDYEEYNDIDYDRPGEEM